MNDERLESLLRETLKRDAVAPQADEAAAARVLARLRVLPQRKVALWHLPGILLNRQFAPAWPRMAALASCAVLGFAIGIAGLDERADSAAPYSFISGTDFGSVAISPSLSGDEP